METEIQTTTIDHPVLARIEQALPGRIENVRKDRPNRIFIEVAPQNIVEVARTLFETLNARLATVSGVDLRDDVEVNYHFCFDSDYCVVTVKTWAAKPDPCLPSVAPWIIGANWIEREINDLIGCRFEGHPNFERLIVADDWPENIHPLSREFQSWGNER